MDRSRAFWVALCGILLAAAALCNVAAQDVKDATGMKVDLPPIELSNNKGMKVTILPLGAIIQRMIVPDKNGKPVDVALGLNKASEYLALNPNPYLGAVIGRVANRIVGSNFTLDGKTYSTSVNDKIPVPGTNSNVSTVNDTIHGGKVGFTFRVWSARKVGTMNGQAAVLNLRSADGDQGFPGNVDTWVVYELQADKNQLQMNFYASTDKATPINLNTHAYFNLNGHNSNTLITDHIITLYSDYYTPTYSNAIVPTGQVKSVNGTVFDLRRPTVIGSVIDKVPGADIPPGYDINMITRLGYPNAAKITDPVPRPVLLADVIGPKSGIEMKVYTNAPGVQWYTGNHLPGPKDKPIMGKDGARYVMRGGFALETQWWPAALQYNNFPSIIVRPGQIYNQQLVWDFTTTQQTKPQQEQGTGR